MLLAAETARSLLLPITKLSRVYLLFRPLDMDLVSSDFLSGLIRSPSELSVVVTSRERTLGFDVELTSKSIVVNSMPFFLRASVMRSRNLERSCLTKNEFLTPIIT